MKAIIIHFRYAEPKHFNDVEIHGEDKFSFYIGDLKFVKSQIVKIEVFP